MNDADRRTSVTYPNGNKIEYGYNAASELTSLTYKQGTTVIGDLTYTYDAVGNRIKVWGSFARSTIPPALASSTYNANNQQTTFGSVTETYDLNGNLATVTEAGITTTYTWNARNQLTAISNPGFSATFSYDSFGRRTGKTISGTTTNFVYDGLNPVQEKSGSTVTANLLTGLGSDEFFTRTDGGGARALLTDALGSTVALADNTGTLQTQYTYEPFGVTSETGATSGNAFKYTGREDDGSGLLYYRARYYHPRLQRFVSEGTRKGVGSHFLKHDKLRLPTPFLSSAQSIPATHLTQAGHDRGPCRKRPWRFVGVNNAMMIWTLVGGVVGKRKDHIKVAEGLARGLSKREAVRQAGYSDSTAEKKAYDIVNRPLVQSALTEALERQGVTFDQILKPLVDALGATLVARTLEGLVKTSLPDHRVRLEAHDRLVRLYGGTPKAAEPLPQPPPGLTIIIQRDGEPAEPQKPVDVTPKTMIQPYGVSTMSDLGVELIRDSER